MIRDWLSYDEKPDDFVFKLVFINEDGEFNDDIVSYLKENIIKAYRSIEFYKFHLEGCSDDEIKKYIKEKVIPSDENTIVKNVRQGDWGEIVSALIAEKFQNLEVPICKLKWKFNKDRAVFATDMIAHNSGDEIKDIHYYEIKTRLHPQNKEKSGKDTRDYITVIAHNSLLKDENLPNETIADFLERYHFENNNLEKARRYKDVVLNPQKYNRNFELFFIIEKSKYVEDILKDLNELPPTLTPLRVTLILIDNLKSIVSQSWDDIEDHFLEIVKS